MVSSKLTVNDSAVLGALFDPEATLQSSVHIDVLVPQAYEQETLLSIERQEREALLSINTEQPTISNIKQAISQLDQIISSYPKYASAWNNRAQARRMLFSDFDNILAQPWTLSYIMDDLAVAIDLATPTPPTSAVSPAQGQVLSSAHTHRGYLLWRGSRSDDFEIVVTCLKGLKGVSREKLEEMASAEFAIGGRYGNKTAQQLAVKTNPYAKLCGSIVKEALQKEIMENNACLSIPVSKII